MPIIFILLLSFLLLFNIPPAFSEIKNQEPFAIKGTIDLSKTNMTKQITKLDGEWEFYWGNLYNPSSFQGTIGSKEPHYFPVPKVWTKDAIDDVPISNEGFATYHLHIQIPDHEVQRPKALYMPSVATSYKLWIDGVFQVENGKVGRSSEEMIPKNFPRLIIFQPKGTDIDLIIQVSNFVQRKGGLWESIRFGNVQPVLLEKLKKVAIELFLIGSLVIIALYHFGLFFAYKKDKSPLYFGCFSLSIAIRSLLLGETIFLRFFPETSWEWAVKVEYWTATFGTLFFVLYVYELFSKEMSKVIRNILVYLGLIMSFIVLITSARFFTQGMQVMQIYIISSFTYLIYVYIRSAKAKLPGSKLNLLAILILFSFILNDILYYNYFINTGYLLSLGLFIFIFGQAFIILLRFSDAFYEKERLNKELYRLTNSLEQIVASRTLELERINQELSKVEQSRRHLFTNISHDLRTPLTAIQGYLKALLDGIIKMNDHKYIKILYGKSIYMDQLLKDLLHLSKLEAKEIKFTIEEVPIIEYIEQLFQKYEWDMRSKNIQSIIQIENYPIPHLQIIALIDKIRIEQVFSNLISNAVKFTPSGGIIIIVCKLNNSEIQIEVKDTGEGMSEDTLSYIFQRYYQETTINHDHEGMGLGLAISKEIIEYHNGKIGATSKLKEGSTFYFTLPIRIEHK